MTRAEKIKAAARMLDNAPVPTKGRLYWDPTTNTVRKA